MSESVFNKAFRKKLEEVAGIRVYRVESHSTSPGMPDNHYIDRDAGADAITGWIEMKEEYCTGLPRKIEYQPAQAPWLIDYSRSGGRCFTALYLPATSKLILIPGRYSALASTNLRLTPHWEFSLESGNVWSSLAGILRASASLPPPDPRIPNSPNTGLSGEPRG